MADIYLDLSPFATSQTGSTPARLRLKDNGDGTYSFGTSATGAPSATATALTNVTSSASSVTVLAANTSRKQATIYNESTSVLYLKLNSVAASATSYTVQIAPSGYYELPSPVYTGLITGIWASANGFARVTEIT